MSHALLAVHKVNLRSEVSVIAGGTKGYCLISYKNYAGHDIALLPCMGNDGALMASDGLVSVMLDVDKDNPSLYLSSTILIARRQSITHL